jgi:NADPH:quinone reductase-like Zn-dependent oxidoreductase
VLAAQVSAPDVTARRGQSPFIPKPPFTPGYAVVGVVEAVGEDVTSVIVGDRVAALTAYGGYSEYLYWNADGLIPVPGTLDPGEAVTLVLNYIVAYHCLHRWARVKAGDAVLVIGASGGIGTAFLQLGKLAGLKTYGVASKGKHSILEEYGANPIDYRSEDFVTVVREAEPDGLDAVFDGMAGESFKRGYALLRRGGALVGYGNPMSTSGMFRLFGQLLLFNLRPDGRSAKLYSTGVSRFNRAIFVEDWALLFRLLEQGRIRPVIHARFPLLEARAANELLESGEVVGNVVLLAPELIE